IAPCREGGAASPLRVAAPPPGTRSECAPSAPGTADLWNRVHPIPFVPCAPQDRSDESQVAVRVARTRLARLSLRNAIDHIAGHLRQLQMTQEAMQPPH